MFPHSDFAMTFSFVVIGTIIDVGVTTLKFINNVIRNKDGILKILETL